MGSATRKQARRAGKDARKLAEARAAELADRARTAWEDSELDERVEELVRALRDSDAYETVSAKSAELVELAREAWKDSDLDERAEELVERIRKSDAGKRAAKEAKRARKTGKKEAKRARKEAIKAAKGAQARADQGLASVGDWLASGETAKKLGVQPRRKWPFLLVLVIGVAIGFAAARLAERTSAAEVRDELAEAAERLASDPGGTGVLADTIRTTLDADPRTAQLEGLEVNVSDSGTVFVRGAVPAQVDQEAVRDVVASVPGVTDVDLQLTSPASS